MKKTSEELIDHALSAVRNTQPPVGMAQRILVHTENQAASRSGLTSAASILSRLGFTHAWQTALAGTGVAACVVALTYTHLHHSQQAIAHKHHDNIVQPQEDGFHKALVAQAVLPVQSISRKPSSVSAQHVDIQATVDDMHLPSQPAPELPLTEQEQILFHIADNHDPALIAQLNPVEREITIAQERAEFENFFKQPPPPDPVPESLPAASTGPSENKTSTPDQTSLPSAKDTTAASTGDHQ